ncbi:stage III sporulation protein AD [Neobacillus piezotolerans]|uniref:Stage III sporulation protein AD n=1 Tax=Neobacillus piezotolerans TaxID=2259171 RepID=A0A3D8GL58_9BACI|nr:stage III sporulation protein AD [Neobacillus piezotolerans]RDU35163.1 stage III sporulation protein AD [Neobacillus piezotolerans]
MAFFKKSSRSFCSNRGEGYPIEILKIVGISLTATFLAMILKEQKPNFAFLLILFTGCMIFLFLVDKIYEIIAMIERIAANAKVNLVYVETILKIIGIAYIAEFAAQVTKDAGQGAIASKIELGGKIIILAMAIPILTVLIETIIKLLPN